MNVHAPNVAFTAAGVGLAVEAAPERPGALIVCGGGRHNPQIMAALAEAVMGQSLADVPVAELRDKLAAQGAYLSPVREMAKT